MSHKIQIKGFEVDLVNILSVVVVIFLPVLVYCGTF